MKFFSLTASRRKRSLNRPAVLAIGILLLAFWLGASRHAAPADQLIFRSPSLEEPFYRIHFPLVVEGDKILIKSLELNGAEAGPFLVFKDGKNVALPAALERGTYSMVLDYAWVGGKAYTAEITYQVEKSNELRTHESAGLSPREGGIPGGKEGFYRVYQVEEEAGIARKKEVVTLTLVAPKADLAPPQIVVFDGPNQVPAEILENMESIAPAAVSATHPPSSTLKIALPIDSKAFQKKLLLVLKGDHEAAPSAGFSVSGEGLGRTIKNSKLILELHPQSGQINTIESKEAGIKLYNKAGVIHWNPDVFVPGVAWDHSFDWNPPAIAEEKAGSCFYLNSRRGPLAHVRGVNLEVKYLLEADAPYFISETRLSFEEGRGVIAVRNDEMVLFRELFDALLYRDNKGEIIRLPLKEKEGTPFGLAHIAAEDLGWVGLVNSREGFGFFSLRLQAYTSTPLRTAIMSTGSGR
jgi:hypothetical protein